jgi:hypothetical protein
MVVSEKRALEDTGGNFETRVDTRAKTPILTPRAIELLEYDC